MTHPLAGRRILILEDEFLVALAAAQSLEDAGATVIGPAYRIAEALELVAAGDIDLALLDINIGGAVSDEVAAALKADGVPVVYATGYGEGMAGSGAAHVLDKPYTDEAMITALTRALDEA